jgi:hypothetical protein
LALTTALVAASALSAPSDLARIERLHSSCSIPEDSVKTAKGEIEGRSLSLVLYTVEGCNGGNNWHSAVTAFDDNGKPLGTYELAEGTSASFSEKSPVRNGRIAIETLSLGPHDPHCCPSIRGKTYLTVKKGKLVRLLR